jgi:acyl-coenzyme A thioesterase PaaI-like protein
VHGGVVAALLDAAMTHCLFHRGVTALTGELRVRYVHPVPCDAELSLGAQVRLERPPLYRLRAELADRGEVMAWAEATFMRRNVADETLAK